MDNTQRRFNVFDWIFIILVIIAIGAAVYYLRSHAASEQDTIQYTVEVPVIRDDIAAQLSAMSDAAVQQDIIDSVKNYAIGKVVSIKVEPAQATVTNGLTGAITQVPYPTFSKVTLTIEADASISNGIYMINGYRINVGTPVYFRLPYLNSWGYCTTLQVTEIAGQPQTATELETQMDTELTAAGQ